MGNEVGEWGVMIWAHEGVGGNEWGSGSSEWERNEWE